MNLIAEKRERESQSIVQKTPGRTPCTSTWMSMTLSRHHFNLIFRIWNPDSV
jgi:hypothetical protein